MSLPQNIGDYLKFIATETARMAWPGSMMRGRHQILKKEAKKKTETFFAEEFPIRALWDNLAVVADDYRNWHRKVCRDLARWLVKHKRMGAEGNIPEAVAAKLLDTFMHQLMKTERFRVLWPELYLPLDRRVFAVLHSPDIELDGKDRINEILRKSPYSISRKEYETVQESLLSLLALQKSKTSFRREDLWTSRIELNCLWL